MTMNFTDPSELRLTGQNPYMMVYDSPDAQAPSTLVSIWHVQYCEAGPGNVLFIRSNDLTDGACRVYSDNINLARWIQEEITGPNMPWADNTLPVVEASFLTNGDARDFITETVTSTDDEITLTWYDLLPPYAGITAPNPERQSMHGHYAVYFPAKRVRVTLNGQEAKGGPLPRQREGWESTSCFLAWAETWVRPKQEQ
jgi:hypothetical protein